MDANRDGDTRWSLIQRAAEGDGDARSSFGRSYLPLVRACLSARWRNSVHAADVDDAVQDVFVECFKPGGPLGRADAATGDFRGFLHGVVRNVALRWEERRRDAARRVHEPYQEVADVEATVSQVFDREWARTLVREAAELMRRQAVDDGARLRVELLRLRFGADLPVRDIAVRFAMTSEAVHRAYARARDEFRVCLRQVVSCHAVRTEAELDDECRRLSALLG